MDPMRALASLEFVSARGLETSDTGPKILANQVNIFLFILKVLFKKIVWDENGEIAKEKNRASDPDGQETKSQTSSGRCPRGVFQSNIFL